MDQANSEVQTAEKDLGELLADIENGELLSGNGLKDTAVALGAGYERGDLSEPMVEWLMGMLHSVSVITADGFLANFKTVLLGQVALDKGDLPSDPAAYVEALHRVDRQISAYELPRHLRMELVIADLERKWLEAVREEVEETRRDVGEIVKLEPEQVSSKALEAEPEAVFRITFNTGERALAIVNNDPDQRYAGDDFKITLLAA